LGYDAQLARAAMQLGAGRDFLAQSDLGVLAGTGAGAVSEAMLKNFRIELGGGYQISRRYAEKVNGVMLGTLALSAFLVLLFFGWCFRRVGVLLYIGAPLLMIVCWTGGIGWLLFGQVNLISCAFAAVLVALGVDYAVHIYNRYIEERARGAEIEAAFATAFRRTGWGVVMGMLTTCLAFLALVAARFNHLAEFGVLGAVGIFLSAPVMMLVMPALLVWRNRWRPERTQIFHPSEFCLPWVAKFVTARRRRLSLLTLLLLVAAVLLTAFSGQLQFEASMAALRPRDRAFTINGEITRAFSTRNPNKLNFIVTAPTEMEALALAASYEPKLEELRRRELIVGYDSVTKFLPAPAAQEKLLAQMRAMNLDAAATALRDSLTRRGLDASYFAFNLRLLTEHARLAERGQSLVPSDFAATKLARLLATMVARRREELDLKYGVPATLPETITLAQAAVTAVSDRLIYPAGTELSRAQVAALIPTDAAVTDKVYGLTYYAGGYAVKAALYPPLPPTATDGEPQLSLAWLQQVAAVLEIDAAQFLPTVSRTEYAAELTGVPIATLVLAEIVKEDFLWISVCVALICLMTINWFYHAHPGRAVLASLPLLAVMLGASVAAPHFTPWTGRLIVGGAVAIFIGGALWHRQVSKTGWCFVPVALGLIYLFGLMALLNTLGHWWGSGAVLNLNFINVLTIPIILGVGIDNGIHLVERYYESAGDLTAVIVDTGRALTITALTSMAGFGSLMWAKFQGLDSIAQLGTLSVLALLMVLLASVVAFPALIKTLNPQPT
jgi:predicted RND superfamily exporter protein